MISGLKFDKVQGKITELHDILKCCIICCGSIHPLLKFYFLLFWGMVVYDNECETKEIKFNPRIKLSYLHRGFEFCLVPCSSFTWFTVDLQVESRIAVSRLCCPSFPIHGGSVILTKSNLSRGLTNLWTSRSSFVVGFFKRVNALLVYFICFHKTFHNKWCLDKTIGQIENGLERGSVKHWLNYV